MVMNFPDDHFVTKYLQWAIKQCDAPWEYHEAMALYLLGASVPDVRAQLTIYPDGLPCNLYLCLIGETTRYRKSTAMNIGETVYRAVDQKGVMPDRMTPEGFIDQLSDRSPGSSLWLHDEFGKFLI